ncbi:MAG: hypothetical protein M1837_001325 [Sclerophora amabilis]|nr:MAG: hypothetical protein M1837_001325 [Sclerophora amabilis]
MGSVMPDFAMSETLGTPGFFTSAIGGGDESTNIFETSFADMADGVGRTKPGKDDDLAENKFLSRPTAFSYAAEDGRFSPLFAFSPHSSPASSKAFLPTPSKQHVESHTAEDDRGLGNSGMFAGLMQNDAARSGPPLQEPSPPHSSHSPLDRWGNKPRMEPKRPSSQRQQPTGNNGPKQVKTRNGQVTPPSDTSPTSPNPDQSLEPQSSHPPSMDSPAPAPLSSANGPKRKRGRQANPMNDGAESGVPKRSKKGRARSKGDGDKREPHREEAQKRTRFLERNRVAASKCRQKKKEWTGNLEGRARDLQNERAQLSMMVGLLKDEVLWLKGELLKHTHCSCDRIRHYLNQEVNHLATGSGAAQYSSQLMSEGSLGMSREHGSGPNPSKGTDSSLGDLTIDSQRGSLFMNSLDNSPVMGTEIAQGCSSGESPPDRNVKIEDDQKLRNLLSAQLGQ